MSFIPELFYQNHRDALNGVKVACLYFDRVIVNSLAPAFPYLKFRRDEGDATPLGTIMITPELRDSERAFLSMIAPLMSEGILAVRGADKETMELMGTMITDLPVMHAHSIDMTVDLTGMPRERVVSWMQQVQAPTLAMMICSLGVPCTDVDQLHQLYRSIAGWQVDEWWNRLPEIERKRLRRDRAALDVLTARLPNVADLHPHQVLELRERMKDGLEAYRAEIGALTADSTAVPGNMEWRAHVAHLMEQRVDPRLGELRRQLDALRRTTILNQVGTLPAAYSTAVMTASLLGAMPTWAAGLAAAGGVLANALYRHLERQAEQATLIGGNPFGVLLETPMNDGRDTTTGIAKRRGV